MRHSLIPFLLLFTIPLPGMAQTKSRPNVLWITSEDNGPHLGAYGDTYADTPHLDRLASRGLTYLNCWSTAPVCAPARTTIISGVYPPSSGSEHMRSMTRLPAFMKMYPEFLREAGYYCTNNSKEDYNLEKSGPIWDASSRKAHWKNRAAGQPFFAIFNHTVSHESQIRKRPHTPIHNPENVRIPAYHPDTPEVRRDWAQYYDKLTEMDARVGANLAELNKAGLSEDTIVIYYGDHGSGMPRSKRWPYNSGLRVPLIVYIPQKFASLRPPEYRTGGQSRRLVGFIDLAPTLLSLVGIKPPAYHQGFAFLGTYQTEPQPFIYGFRGRMDERYDMVRTVRDQRYIYIRNYMPHKIYGQYIAYMFQTPTTRVWRELYDQNKLQPPQTHFWETKPAEELYDLQEDPDEVRNLARSAEHQEVLQRLRRAQRSLATSIRDVGFLPESEIHSRSGGKTPYDMGHDQRQYPLERILATADLASSHSARDAVSRLSDALTDSDSAVRYWAAMGLLIRGKPAVVAARSVLTKAVSDSAAPVRIIAAQALGQYGGPEDVRSALAVLTKAADARQTDIYNAMLALNALDAMDARAASQREVIQTLPTTVPGANRRMRAYLPNLVKKTLSDLGPEQRK
ncbi:MAG: sulfatase-like hydrolase/transferase [Planctomycetaceae bacterium]